MKKEMKAQAEQKPSGRQAALVSALVQYGHNCLSSLLLQGIAPTVPEQSTA